MQAAYPLARDGELRSCKSIKKSARKEVRSHGRAPLSVDSPKTPMLTQLLTKWLSLSLAIALTFAPQASASAPTAEVASHPAQASAGWRARSADNICGLSILRQVNDPARLDYKRVLEATPEMKDLVRRGIKPNSAEGQILHQRAVDRVRRASSLVMQRKDHCSIWKRISHRDARKVRDRTSEVIAALQGAQ